jgi:hypothetical protein
MKIANIFTQIFFSVLVTVTLSSCKSYVKYKHGITKPYEETPGSLINFLEKNKFPGNNIYIFADSAEYIHAYKNEIFRQNLLGHMIFDRKGQLLIRDTTKCQWAGADLIRRLHPDSIYPTTRTLTVDQLLKNIIPVGTVDSDKWTAQIPDFTLIVCWAKFLGKYNYRLFDLEGALKENQHSKIRLIWLNIDMQKSWHLKPNQKLSVN